MGLHEIVIWTLNAYRRVEQIKRRRITADVTDSTNDPKQSSVSRCGISQWIWTFLVFLSLSLCQGKRIGEFGSHCCHVIHLPVCSGSRPVWRRDPALPSLLEWSEINCRGHGHSHTHYPHETHRFIDRWRDGRFQNARLHFTLGDWL